MDQHAPDLTYVLPRHLYHHVVHALRAALPPPPADTQEDLTRRDHAAIAQVAALLPANGEEVALAAQFVAANAHALDCLRLARQSPNDILLELKCRAQSASMMRQARGARSLLLSVQARRLKREASASACDSAAYLEHCAIGLMTDALEATAPMPGALVIDTPAVETSPSDSRGVDALAVDPVAEKPAADASTANAPPTAGRVCGSPTGEARPSERLTRTPAPQWEAGGNPAPAPVRRTGPRRPAPPCPAPPWDEFPARPAADQPPWDRPPWATTRHAYEAPRAGP